MSDQQKIFDDVLGFVTPLERSICPPICECCHTFVNDGRVHFLSGCTHEFAGQTLDLLDVEE
jgi:hypothetical protein